MAKQALTFTPLGKILNTEYPDFDNWLVRDLIPLNGLTIFSGAPASFKSYISQHLALCVAKQTPFLERFEVPSLREVLYFDKEGRPRYIQKRFKALGAVGDPYVEINRDDDFFLDDNKDVERLLTLLKEPQYAAVGLIVFDSLIRYHRKDENAATQMAAVFRNAKKIAEAGPAVVMIQHSRKEFEGTGSSANSIRGSGDILAAVDAQFSLAQDRKQGVVSFVNNKQREAPELDPFAAKIVRENDEPKGTPIGFKFVGEYDKDRPKVEGLKDTLISIFNEKTEELTREDVYEQLGDECSKALANRALENLTNERYLSRRTGARGRRFYSRTPDISETTVENPVVND